MQKRLNHEYKPSPQKMKHVHAVLQMMSIMTGDHRFEDAYNDAIQKEELNMCEVLDRVEKKGYDAGRIAGKIDVFYHEQRAKCRKFLMNRNNSEDFERTLY